MANTLFADLVLKELKILGSSQVYFAGYEDNTFRLDALTRLLIEAIPEFVFGPHLEEPIVPNNSIQRVREAVRKIYTSPNFRGRGEFGEVILHVLLREFHGTETLISKIYFKSATNETVKGFDAVHVREENGKRELWLGESKFFTSGPHGVTGLANDLRKHFEADYLRDEFLLISSKIPQKYPDREHWLKLLDGKKSLKSVFQDVVVPAVCTYRSRTVKSYQEESGKFIEDLTRECGFLEQRFHARNIRKNLKILLIFLPIPDKKEMVALLDKKLKGIQII